jgi:hypothetical protein
MTGAERTRLYRLKHSAAKPVTKPVTTPGTDAAALEQELAQAKARIPLERDPVVVEAVGRRGARHRCSWPAVLAERPGDLLELAMSG